MMLCMLEEVTSNVNLYIPIILFFTGIALIFTEVFIPSAGIIGILAITSMISAVFFAFRIGTTEGIIFIVLSLVGSIAAVVLGYRILPYTPIGKKLFVMGGIPTETERRAVDRKLATLLGKEGVAISVLRPAGFAEIDDQRVDVVTNGEMIEVGAKIKVIQIDGNRAVVEKIEE